MASRRSRNAAKGAAKFNPEESQKSLQFFLASIQDPHKPKHCGKCLLGASLSFTVAERRSILAGTPTGKSTTDTRGNLDLWRTVYAFLFTKRTDEQLEKLLRRLSQCSCSSTETDVRLYHDRAKLIAGQAMERSHMDVVSPKDKLVLYTADRCAFVIDLFLVLDAVIQQSGVVSVAKRSSTAWPTTPMDLVPFGADSLVESLIQWYKFVPDTIVFKLTAHILRVTRFLLIPSLVKFKFSRAVVEAARTLADRSVLALDSGDFQARQRIAEIFPYHISDLLIYNTQTSQKHIPTDCRAELIRGVETKAMQVYCMLLYISEDPKMPKITYRPQGEVGLLAAEVQLLFRFFHMHLYPRPDIPLHPRAVLVDRISWPPPASVRDLKETASFYIGAFREETRCSAYKCTNSLQSEGRNFQRCARCNVVSYCGRECQMKAWREEKYPHKKVCPVLRNLIQLGGGLEPVCDFLASFGVWESWMKAGVHEDDFQLIKDWGKLTVGVYKMPDGTEWTPGYDDYEEIITNLTSRGRGAKALYMNRLARWPSEVAQEKTLLQDQVFWDADMDV